MILDVEETNNRLSSPHNLLNKLKSLTVGSKKNAVELFTGKVDGTNKSNPSRLPWESEAVKETLDEVESELRDGLIKNAAKDVLGSSLVHLSKCLGSIDKPVEFARIATDMSKIVENLERTAKANAPQTVNQQVVIYRPVVNNESTYQTVHVSE